MMEKLLVPMTGHNAIETLMPCLEMLARPGMTVIFLFHYPVDSASYFRDHRITVESTRHATALGRAVADRYNWEAQKERARQMIAPAMKVLEASRVGVEVHLCSGRWAKAINQYRLDKDVRWIVSQFSRSGLMSYWLAKTMTPSGWSSHCCLCEAMRGFSRTSSKSTQDEEPARSADELFWRRGIGRKPTRGETNDNRKSLCRIVTPPRER